MSFEKRLNIFIDICYNGNVSAFSTEAELLPSTVSRWIKKVDTKSMKKKTSQVASDPKLSHILKLSSAGCNVAWLISGKGTMFAWNEKGIKLQNEKLIRNKIKNEVDSINPLKVIQNLRNKLSKKFNVKEGEINLEYNSNFYEEINNKCKNLFTNYLFILLTEKIEFQKKEDLLQGIEPSFSIDMDFMKPYLPAIIGALIHYIGEDPLKMFLESEGFTIKSSFDKNLLQDTIIDEY